MKESRTVEYKETVTNTFLKTVSAYANYGTGKIIFGVTDDGAVIGVSDPEKVCLDIENRINDSVDPVPSYAMKVDAQSGVITLTVEEGEDKPYFYKSKAYRRSDTATIEVDRPALNRLILESSHLIFEELRARNQELTFAVLTQNMQVKLGIQEVSKDILKTLGLYSDTNGYNQAAALLADENSFYGTDIVRFGENINVISDRQTIAHASVLRQLDAAMVMYRRYYRPEVIRGMERISEEWVPEDAFREAMANALIHRAWDARRHVQVAMYADRIEITSPGGLPQGITEEEYLRGSVSVLRNPVLGGVFFRLGLMEQFGTGIRRIRSAYRESDAKPTFSVSANTIYVTLPVVSSHTNLSGDEQRVYQAIKHHAATSTEIARTAGFGKTKTVGLLNALVAAGYVRSTGNGRGTRYVYA